MSPEDEDVDASFRRRISSIDFPKPSAPYPEYGNDDRDFVQIETTILYGSLVSIKNEIFIPLFRSTNLRRSCRPRPR